MGLYAITGCALPEGGQHGIGGALRKRLLADGHEVISIDRRDADVLVDLSNDEGRREAIAAIRRHASGGLDGLATIAAVGGGNPNGPRGLVNVNFFGSIELVEGVRDLLAARRGAVTLCSSHTFVLFQDEELVDLYLTLDREKVEAGVEGRAGMAVYASGKKALVLWMRRQVPAYSADGIRMNAVVPGFTDTPMTTLEGRSEKELALYEDFRSKIPLGQRMARPEETAAAFRFLLSEEASFVNGTTLFVDGGHDTDAARGCARVQRLSGGGIVRRRCGPRPTSRGRRSPCPSGRNRRRRGRTRHAPRGEGVRGASGRLALPERVPPEPGRG